MSRQVDLNSEYLSLIKKILQSHLPPHTKAWLFGSRATGKAKKFSDIDLLIDMGEPISQQKLTELNLAFEESNLPYKVDIADALAISDSFRKNILTQLIDLSI